MKKIFKIGHHWLREYFSDARASVMERDDAELVAVCDVKERSC